MLIVTGADRIVTMDRARRVLTGAAVAVADGRIAAVGSAAAIVAAHPEADVLEADGGWVLPGLIDAHQHLTGDRLARASIPDDSAWNDAIFSWAVPLHAAHTPEDISRALGIFARVGSALGVTRVALS